MLIAFAVTALVLFLAALAVEDRIEARRYARDLGRVDAVVAAACRQKSARPVPIIAGLKPRRAA